MVNLKNKLKLMGAYSFALLFTLSSFAVAGSLSEAVKDGNFERVKSFITEGSDVNVSNENGLSPLHMAAYKGHKDIAELLILSGANVNAGDKRDTTPLHLAADRGYRNIAELLIQNGANVNAVTIGCSGNNVKWTPLSKAIYKKHKDVAELLILKGANVNFHFNESNLHLAVRSGQKEIVEILILKGANVNAVNKAGITPLNLADEKGYKGIADMLIKHGGHK